MTPEVNVKDIGVTANNASFVLYNDGTLKYSGNKSSIGSTGTTSTTPTLTTVTTGVLQINSENAYSANYVLKSDGLYVFGSQIDGQLGDGTDGTINSLRTITKIPASSIPSTAIDYIGGSNFEAHVRAGGIWYFAGRGNASGDGITNSNVIKTWRACTNITEPVPYDKMTHGYMITFMLKTVNYMVQGMVVELLVWVQFRMKKKMPEIQDYLKNSYTELKLKASTLYWHFFVLNIV
ncbi:UNVERIFIED_ORG: hypothetical protein [Escherichia phage CMSTMSU]